MPRSNRLDAYGPDRRAARPLPSTESRAFQQQEAQRARIDQLQQEALARHLQVDRHLDAFKSRLSLPQLRCGWGEGVSDEAIALHSKLFGWRFQRGGDGW